MPELTYRLKTESGLSDQLTPEQLAARVADGKLSSEADCTPDDGDTWYTVGVCVDSAASASGLASAADADSSQVSSDTRPPTSNDTVASAPKRKLKKLNTARPRSVDSIETGPSGIPKDLSVIVGQSLANGRYVVKSQFGAGSMAYVFRASDSRLETDVIVKVPKPEKITTEDYRERFHRESQLLVRLSHPHVVKVLDVGEFMRLPYVVMQLLSGGTLLERIQDQSDDKNRMTPESLKDWIREVSRALDFCYKRGMVHRDVKPANILFDDDNNAYVSDFGLTKIMHGEHTELCSSGTADGIVLGTPNYLPPEIILGGKYDGRADQYSLGLTVYHALCGQPPMQGKSATATMVNQTRRKLDLLSNIRPDVPRELALAIDKSIEKNPKNRFESCVEFAEAALEGLRTDSNSSRSTVLPTDPSSQSSGRRSRASVASSSSRSAKRKASSSASSRRSRSASAKRKSPASTPAAASMAVQDPASAWLEPTIPPRRKKSSRKPAQRKKQAQAKQLVVFGRPMSLPIFATVIAAAILFPVVIAYNLWAGGEQAELAIIKVANQPPGPRGKGRQANNQQQPVQVANAKPEPSTEPKVDSATATNSPVTRIGMTRSYSSGIADGDVDSGAESAAFDKTESSENDSEKSTKNPDTDAPDVGRPESGYSSGAPTAATDHSGMSTESDIVPNELRLGDSEEPLTVSGRTAIVGNSVWDVVSQEQTVQLRGQYPPDAARAISQDGRYFAAATTSVGRSSAGATIWDTTNGRVVATLPVQPERQIDLILIGDEKAYFGNRYTDELVVLGFSGPKARPRRLRFAGARFLPGQTAITGNGEFIAAPKSNALVVFQARDGQPVGKMSLPKSIARTSSRTESMLASLRELRFSRRGNELAAVAVSPTPQLLIWDSLGELQVEHSLDDSAEEMNFSWVGRRSVFCLGKTLNDRDSNRVLFSSEGPLHSFGRDAAIIASDSGLVVKDIPWIAMTDSLDAMQTDRAAPLHPSKSVSVVVSLGKLSTFDQNLHTSVRDAIRQQLERNGLRIVENSTNRIVAHVSAQPEESILRIEYYTASSLDPIWAQNVADVSELFSVEGEERAKQQADLVRRVRDFPIPYYLPSNSKLASLPINLH